MKPAARLGLAEGMVIHFSNVPGREAWNARVVEVTNNEDGTVTVTTNRVDDWELVGFSP